LAAKSAIGGRYLSPDPLFGPFVKPMKSRPGVLASDERSLGYNNTNREECTHGDRPDLFLRRIFKETDRYAEREAGIQESNGLMGRIWRYSFKGRLAKVSLGR